MNIWILKYIFIFTESKAILEENRDVFAAYKWQMSNRKLQINCFGLILVRHSTK